MRYNVAICSECSTGLAFDWVQSHLRNKHGIKKQLEDVKEYLNIEAPILSSIEIERWISEIWIVSQGFQGIPIKMGMACNECHYSCVTKKSMKDHFRAQHPGMKWADSVTGCKVQMPFQGHLKKYIQIEGTEGSDTEMCVGNDWQDALEQDFKEAMNERASSASNGHPDMHLLSAFIAKMRWDLCIKDMNTCELQKLTAAPVKSDMRHKVMLCGRKYIENCCNALSLIKGGIDALIPLIYMGDG